MARDGGLYGLYRKMLERAEMRLILLEEISGRRKIRHPFLEDYAGLATELREAVPLHDP